MTALAVWLLLVGGLDLVRSRRQPRPVVLLALAGAGAVLSLLVAVALRPSTAGWAAWVVAALGIAGWIAGSGVAVARFGQVSTPRLLARVTPALAAATAYASFSLGVTALVLAGSAAGSGTFLVTGLARSGLGHLPAERVLLVVATLLLQISTANVIVRLLLDLVGVPASDNEKTLRGGRVLGPMERLLILGLGVGGSLTGAAIVVAAKSLLRFPELRVPRPVIPATAAPATSPSTSWSAASPAGWWPWVRSGWSRWRRPGDSHRLAPPSPRTRPKRHTEFAEVEALG